MSAVAAYPGLSGQHVFITGAARGLGRSMAEKLAGCGATVAVTDVDAGGCEEVVKGIRAAGGAAFAYCVDVAVREQMLRRRRAVCRTGRPHRRRDQQRHAAALRAGGKNHRRRRSPA